MSQWVETELAESQLHDARHTAAIVYGARGPCLAVLLTYRPGITRPQAAALGRRVVALCDDR